MVLVVCRQRDKRTSSPDQSTVCLVGLCCAPGAKSAQALTVIKLALDINLALLLILAVTLASTLPW